MSQLAYLLAAALIVATPGFVLQFTSAVDCTPGVAPTCQNGGICNNFTASPSCICPLPYIGSNCAAAANYCSTLQPEKGITSFPVCLNNGTCTMGYSDPYFNCSCPVIQTVVYSNCTCVNKYAGMRCNNTAVTMTKGSALSVTVGSISECGRLCNETSTLPIGSDFLSPESKIAIGVLIPVAFILIVGVLWYLCCCKKRPCVNKSAVGCLGNGGSEAAPVLGKYGADEPSPNDVAASSSAKKIDDQKFQRGPSKDAVPSTDKPVETSVTAEQLDKNQSKDAVPSIGKSVETSVMAEQLDKNLSNDAGDTSSTPDKTDKVVSDGSSNDDGTSKDEPGEGMVSESDFNNAPDGGANKHAVRSGQNF